jgi:hypothetical protein
MANGSRGPEEKPYLRHASLFGWGGGLGYFPEEMFSRAPLRLRKANRGVLREAIFRRELLRNRPFLPGPCEAFLRILTNQIGDDLNVIILPLFFIYQQSAGVAAEKIWGREGNANLFSMRFEHRKHSAVWPQPKETLTFTQ